MLQIINLCLFYYILNSLTTVHLTKIGFFWSRRSQPSIH